MRWRSACISASCSPNANKVAAMKPGAIGCAALTAPPSRTPAAPTRSRDPTFGVELLNRGDALPLFLDHVLQVPGCNVVRHAADEFGAVCVAAKLKSASYRLDRIRDYLVSLLDSILVAVVVVAAAHRLSLPYSLAAFRCRPSKSLTA